METTLSSSFPRFFICISQIPNDGYIPTKNSPGFNTDLLHSHWQFLRLVPETLSRFPRQLTEKRNVFSILPTAMTNRWHFDIAMTQFENLKRHCIGYICFVTWSTLKSDYFWHIFGSMGFLQLEDEKFTN